MKLSDWAHVFLAAAWVGAFLIAVGVLAVVAGVRDTPARVNAQSYNAYTTAQPYALTPALTAVSTPQIPANNARIYLRCSNDSDTVMYLSLGPTPSLNNGVRLNASGGLIEWADPLGNLYQGSISAITSASGKLLMCIEGSK